MNRSIFVLTFLSLTLVFGMVGCANPAADAPEATVEEVAETPETSAPAPAEEAPAGTVYGFAQSSTIGFVGSKVTGSHDGGFNSFDGELVVVEGDLTKSRVSVVIATNSLWSDNDNLTGHLKSADFFDVATYPTSTFESTEIAANDDGTYTMTGNLSLHGVTKSISFPATIEMVDGGVNAKAEFSIKRFDFGIEYPGRADDLIRDEVLIKLDLQGIAAG